LRGTVKSLLQTLRWLTATSVCPRLRR